MDMTQIVTDCGSAATEAMHAGASAIDYLKVGSTYGDVLRWIVLLIIAFLYRQPIARAMQRIGALLDSFKDRSAKLGPIEFGAPNAAAQATEPNAGPIPNVQQAPSPPTAQDPLSRELVDIVRQQLAGVPEDDAREKLMGWVAHWSILSQFYRVHGIIFASQVTLLRVCNTEQGNRVSRARAYSIYDVAVRADPEFYKDYSVDQWLGFLELSLLVQLSEDQVGLTVRGASFLQFLVREQLRDACASNLLH